MKKTKIISAITLAAALCGGSSVFAGSHVHEREHSRTNGTITEQKRERELPDGFVLEQRQEQRTNAAGHTQTRSQERHFQLPSLHLPSLHLPFLHQGSHEREHSRTNGTITEQKRELELPNGSILEQVQEQRTDAAGHTQTRSKERTIPSTH